jgi:transcriptional regulator with PAS, ATPase and Fis domain
MIRLMREALIMHSAPSVPVLIEGETGTGKEVLARRIHNGDSVAETPFMAINCAAIPQELFESELFGHEAGAFTGSRAEGAAGKLEQAGKGTLFLDEVAEMPLHLQPKLLRVLEERSFYRVGGIKKREFTARIVCAGNRDIADMVEKGAFRRDLYHRLRVGHLFIPPLRERGEEIRSLAKHFLRREVERKKKAFLGFASATLSILYDYPWPGNVRELENTIERAVLMHDGELLLPEHVDFLFGSRAHRVPVHPLASNLVSGTSAAPALPVFDLHNPQALILPEQPFQLDELMNAVVAAALDKFAGNKTRAAHYLGISRFALHRRLQQKAEEIG